MLYQLSHVRVPPEVALRRACLTLAESRRSCVLDGCGLADFRVQGGPEGEFGVLLEVGDAAPELAVLGLVGGGEGEGGHDGGAGGRAGEAGGGRGGGGGGRRAGG